MRAAEAAGNRVTVALIARGAHVRAEAVVRALTGAEVLARTYEAVRVEAELAGVTEIPPLAPRAPRRPPAKPCPECARLRAWVAELEAERGDERPVGGPAHSFVDREGTLQVAPGCNVILTGLTADDEPPAPRLAVVPPTRPVVSIDLSAVPPGAMTETG